MPDHALFAGVRLSQRAIYRAKLCIRLPFRELFLGRGFVAVDPPRLYAAVPSLVFRKLFLVHASLNYVVEQAGRAPLDVSVVGGFGDLFGDCFRFLELTLTGKDLGQPQRITLIAGLIFDRDLHQPAGFVQLFVVDDVHESEQIVAFGERGIYRDRLLKCVAHLRRGRGVEAAYESEFILALTAEQIRVAIERDVIPGIAGDGLFKGGAGLVEFPLPDLDHPKRGIRHARIRLKL